MKRSLRILLLAVTALSIAAADGCIFSPDVDPPKPIDEIEPQTSPEAVVRNLVASYRLRRIEEYAKLLAPEFIFLLQPADAQEIETDFYTRDADSLGTQALFETPLVSNITISLIFGDAVPSSELNHPPGAMEIFVSQTQLEVDETNGTTWLVQDQQRMYFRRGNADAGEDSTLWFLFEWRDLPTAAAPRIGTEPLGSPVPQTLPTSWGAIRRMALEGELEPPAD